MIRSWFKIPSMSAVSDAEQAWDVSSANSRDMLTRFSDMSLTYTRKSNGPRTEPCGTPAFIDLDLDLAVLTMTD